jgi:geranylgeranyl pyrophosphate synthase
LDLTSYAAALAARFTGYFEAGRHSAQRYRLVWHVLNSTFTSRKPLFEICRRAALFPEGVGETYTRELLDDVRPFIWRGTAAHPDRDEMEAAIRTDLMSIGELLVDIVRRDWPFLSQLITAEQMVPGIPFRPALLLLLAGRVGAPPRGALVTVGAALELGYLATLAQASVEEDLAPPDPIESGRPTPANWGNMFALMVGDLLYGHAYAMTAETTSEVASLVARALSISCEGHVLTLRRAFDVTHTPEDYLKALAQKIAPLFELPCCIGAMLSGATRIEIESLSAFGRSLGMAYQLVDEALTVSGRPTQFGRAVQPDLQDGIYSFPILHVVHGTSSAPMTAALKGLRENSQAVEQVYALARESGGVEATLERANLEAEKARQALASMPYSRALAALLGLVDYTLSRAVCIGSYAVQQPPRNTNSWV